ncbi:MAG: T9SS type A sorting domain-containing protein [Bacteroidia bacterium]
MYNLPCSLTTGLNLDKTINNDINESNLVVYPNPSFYHTTIKFSLPNGVNYGNIILKDLLGKEIKRYKIDNTFSELLIEQDQIPAGIYIYSLETNNSVIDSKKIILKSN